MPAWWSRMERAGLTYGGRGLRQAHVSQLLGTTRLDGGKWLLTIAPAIALFFLWELGKLLARSRHHASAPAN